MWCNILYLLVLLNNHKQLIKESLSGIYAAVLAVICYCNPITFFSDTIMKCIAVLNSVIRLQL